MYTLKVSKFFEASHQLPAGLEGLYTIKCADLHGHTYLVEVKVEIDTTAQMDMVIDFGIIKDIIDRLDHKHLGYDNSDIKEFSVIFPPTAENIARWIHDKIYKDTDYKTKVKVIEGYKGEHSAYVTYQEEPWMK